MYEEKGCRGTGSLFFVRRKEHLRSVLPDWVEPKKYGNSAVFVICLRKYFNKAAENENGQKKNNEHGSKEKKQEWRVPLYL